METFRMDDVEKALEKNGYLIVVAKSGDEAEEEIYRVGLKPRRSPHPPTPIGGENRYDDLGSAVDRAHEYRPV